MKQRLLFNIDTSDDERYTKKVNSPIYAPRKVKPNIIELIDKTKTRKLIKRIESSNVTEEEKKFLLAGAMRHNVFHYERIADYYAHASKEMQELMEESALVIIDFYRAIELGFIELTEQLKKQYLEEYESESNE